MALTNTAATIPGIVVPIFVGWLTHGNVSNITCSYDNQFYKTIIKALPLFHNYT